MSVICVCSIGLTHSLFNIVQFCAIEVSMTFTRVYRLLITIIQIARNRLGLNDEAHELAKREAEKEKKKLEEQKLEAEKLKKFWWRLLWNSLACCFVGLAVVLPGKTWCIYIRA